MTRALTLAACALALLACNNADRKLQTAIEEFDTLSRDLCMQGWLDDAQRDHVKQSFVAGRLPPETVDAYIKDIRARVRYGEKSNMGNETFCRLQRNTFRKHFLK